MSSRETCSKKHCKGSDFVVGDGDDEDKENILRRRISLLLLLSFWCGLDKVASARLSDKPEVASDMLSSDRSGNFLGCSDVLDMIDELIGLSNY